MANGQIVRNPPGDILKHFAQRTDLRSMAYVGPDELDKFIWIFDTNVFVDPNYFPKCQHIVQNGNFRVSQDVIDELTRGAPVSSNSEWGRACQLAHIILQQHHDKIFSKPDAQIVKELLKLSTLMTKPYIQKVTLDNIDQIYSAFRNSKDKNQTLDNFIHAINNSLNDTLRRNFESRAKGIVQDDKVSHIIGFFLHNMKVTLRDIFHNIMKYSSLDLDNCRQMIQKHFFRPIDSDVRIAADYIEHHKPRHHLGSNDKDVVELIILHEYRGA
jgi:hypothetical protein